MFRANVPRPAEDNIKALDDLYLEWERRILWRVNATEEKRHDALCGGTKPGEWCKCRMRQEEIHEWEDWASENLGRTIDEIDWGIPVRLLNRVQNESTRRHYSESSSD